MKHIKEYKGFVNEAAIDGDRQMITRAIENMASGRLKVKDIAKEIGRAIDQANIGSTMKEFLKYALQIKKESIDEKANPEDTPSEKGTDLAKTTVAGLRKKFRKLTNQELDDFMTEIAFSFDLIKKH